MLSVLVNIQQMNVTLVQAVQALANHDPSISYKDLLEAIIAIRESGIKETIKEEEYARLIGNINEVENSLRANNRNNVLRSFEGYFNYGINLMNVKIYEVLKKTVRLDKELALNILKIYEENGFSSKDRAVIFFTVCKIIAYDMPDISYVYTIRAFEEYPALLKDFGESKLESYKAVDEERYEQCPICMSEEIRPYYNAQVCRSSEYETIFSPSKLWCKCDSCGNLFAYNFPTHCVSTRTYKQSQINETGQVIMEPRVSLSIFGDLINKLRSYTSGSEFLEVGIGTGDFIAVAREMGVHVEGVELMPDFCKQVEELLGFKAVCCDFLDFKTDKRYDVLTMGDIIEHVKNPKLALRKAYELLKDDGVLWISTPNYESAFSQMMKFSDPMWIELWHRTYFNYSGFKALLEECGFKVLEYQVSHRYRGSMEIIASK